MNTQLRCNIQWWQTMTNAKDWMCCQTKQRVHQLVTQFVAWFLFFNPATRFQKPLHSQMGKLGVEARFLFWTPVLLFWKSMIIMCTMLPAFPSLFFNFLCGYFTDMSQVALRTDHDILRTFLELKNASEFILMYTTRFVLCQVHSYMTDMQMYTTANAEMTFTPPRYWNISNYR
jgi:hypothetical protein